MTRKQKAICEKLGWNILTDENDVMLSQYSPAGEDFFFYAEKARFKDSINEYAEDFDPDEHAIMWIENMHTVKGVPQSIRTLINDLVLFQYSTDDNDGVDTQAFDTYEKAVKRFNEIIENEQKPEMSWAANAFENGQVLHSYELDRSNFSDGEEHELWWYLTCKVDWYLHDFIELRILEVQ